LEFLQLGSFYAGTSPVWFQPPGALSPVHASSLLDWNMPMANSLRHLRKQDPRGAVSRIVAIASAILPSALLPSALLPSVLLASVPSPGAAFEVGTASYYGRGHAGRRTASGTRFDPAAMTAAHRKLPFGSRVRVTNLRNGRAVVVLISDRGPYTRNRLIDLSYGAAHRLDFVRDGTARVRLDTASR
jgi:rare lipoprotein A